jgi:uncharacterized protein
MKKIFLFILTGYQTVLSPLLHLLLGQKAICRYPLSCSAYAKEKISKKGVVRGGLLALSRIASCR